VGPEGNTGPRAKRVASEILDRVIGGSPARAAAALPADDADVPF
jgi:hypothetical protein